MQVEWTISIGNILTMLVMALGVIAAWFKMNSRIDSIHEWRESTVERFRDGDSWRNKTNDLMSRSIVIIELLEKRVNRIEDNHRENHD